MAQPIKTVILCGGKGTRLAEETSIQPKSMVTIGGSPILLHIMKIYAHFGHCDFVLALGYLGEKIKHYFLNYYAMGADLRVNLGSNGVEFKGSPKLDWNVSLIDTGTETMTGGRLRRLEPELRSGGTFMLTYGDGVANININSLLDFHRAHGRIATVTAVRPRARFGRLSFNEDLVTSFVEKPDVDQGWINGGFFVFQPEVFDYLDGDACTLERDPLEKLAIDKQLMAYKHSDYWQCMDTLRDRIALEEEWATGHASWQFLPPL